MLLQGLGCHQVGGLILPIPYLTQNTIVVSIFFSIIPLKDQASVVSNLHQVTFGGFIEGVKKVTRPMISSPAQHLNVKPGIRRDSFPFLESL